MPCNKAPEHISKSLGGSDIAESSQLQHHYQDLIDLFSQCFAQSHNTRLLKGEGEPIYLPADQSRPFHAIYFAHGFFSSALHECAHWLIAGEERRMQTDFGYWYIPDGRSPEQQQLFEQVEVKPQAIEWILSDAAGFRFNVSVDNLSGEVTDSQPFKDAVYRQVVHYAQHGLPARAELFRAAIAQHYGRPDRIEINRFDPASL